MKSKFPESKLYHQHVIIRLYSGITDKAIHKSNLGTFLLQLVKSIHMKVMISPIVKLSKNHAWTGIVGITTSHISFHYWRRTGLVQIDVYSCKKYDPLMLVKEVEQFWRSTVIDAIQILRNEGRALSIKKIIPVPLSKKDVRSNRSKRG